MPAQKNGIEYIGLAKTFEEMGESVYVDFLHFNEHAHVVVAEKLAALLEKGSTYE